MEIPEPTNPWQPSPTAPTESAAPAAGTPARTRRPGRAIAFVAAGAIAATGITGLAFAADNGPSPTPSASDDSTAPDGPGGMMGDGRRGGMMGDRDGDGGHGRGGPGGMGGHGGLGLGGRVQHGEAVVTKDDGATATVRVQSGTISSVSATEMVVKSDDGFEQTWPLTAETSIHKSRSDATAADLAVGDTVMVLGEVKDGSVTTLRVGALTAAEAAQREAMRQQFEKDHPGGPLGAPGRPGDDDGDGPAGSGVPNPSASPGATTSGYTA